MADVFVLSVGEPFEGYDVLSVHASLQGAANSAAMHAERQLEFHPAPAVEPDHWSSERTAVDEYMIRRLEVQS
jgi:hypothetical protein